MRHHGVTEDTRDGILATLDQLGLDRTHHGKEAKAREYAQAIHAIEAGALEVRVRHMLYRVVGEQRPRQYLTTEATREATLEALTGWRKHWTQAAAEHAELAAEFAQAVAAVEHGALAVFAGREMYIVVEDDLGEPEHNPDQAAIDTERDVRVAAVQDALVED